ncbi:hypothetical protein V8F20_001787 [Naviculisporaceae sp. PSN 640]
MLTEGFVSPLCLAKEMKSGKGSYNLMSFYFKREMLGIMTNGHQPYRCSQTPWPVRIPGHSRYYSRDGPNFYNQYWNDINLGNGLWTLGRATYVTLSRCIPPHNTWKFGLLKYAVAKLRIWTVDGRAPPSHGTLILDFETVGQKLLGRGLVVGGSCICGYGSKIIEHIDIDSYFPNQQKKKKKEWPGFISTESEALEIMNQPKRK